MQEMHTHANAWSTRMMIILTMLVVTLPSWGQYRRRGGLLDGEDSASVMSIAIAVFGRTSVFR